MPRTKLTDEQKAMIRALPEREKDKLLLRLVAKDQLLLEQLSFQHLEDAGTTDARADELREYYRHALRPEIGYSPGELMMALRSVSGYCTRHVRVTKDKLGEVTLMLDALYVALVNHLPRMRKRYRSYHRWHKFAAYVTKRLPTLLRRADKLHPDLWMEFEGQLNELLTLVWDTPELSGEAERQGLPRRWEPAGA